MEKVMKHRQQQYFEFRKIIAMRAKYFFIVLLSNRNYTGKMSFNHSKETLEMNVSAVVDAVRALILTSFVIYRKLGAVYCGNTKHVHCTPKLYHLVIYILFSSIDLVEDV
jgi:hypothetical protein